MKKKIFMMLLVIPLCVLSACTNNNSDYEKLQSEYNNLKSNYDNLREDFANSQDEYQSLLTDYESLKTEYDTLQSAYDELELTYTQETTVVYETPTNLDEYATDVTYDNLSRKPDEYEGKAIKMSGEVVQLMESAESIDIRLALGGDYDEMVYLVYDPNIIEERVLEDDDITFYGVYYGIYQYESTMGATISIPLFSVDYIEIN